MSDKFAVINSTEEDKNKEMDRIYRVAKWMKFGIDNIILLYWIR